MEYELKTLDLIVLEMLHPGKLKQVKLNASFIAKYKLIAHVEKDRIKLQFIQAGFEQGGEGRMELYIRQHQTALVQLADAIYFYQHSKSNESVYRVIKDASIIKLYAEIYHCLDCLLNFIENRFSNYYNQDGKIPEAYRWSIAPEIKNNVILIKKEFRKYEVPDVLIKIVCEPFEYFLLPGVIVSCRELKYLMLLQQELIALVKKADMNNFKDEIFSLLMHLNFNCIQFFKYYIEHLLETGRMYKSKNELEAFYSLKMKFINQVIVKPGAVYKPNQLFICEQIGRWLGEELHFLNKQQPDFVQPEFKQEPIPQKQKVHTSLTVDHLSLVIRVLLDGNIIKTKNATELLKLAARSFSTDYADNISENSLRNKFYNFDENTIDQVKDVIKGLMGVVMRY